MPLRRTATILSTLGLVAGLLTVAAPAHAATASCAPGYGTLVATRAVVVSGKPELGSVGTITLRSNSNRSAWCAYLQKREPAYGEPHPTSLTLKNTVTGAYRTDSGNFLYYAGPVYLSTQANTCVWASGVITYGGYQYTGVAKGSC